MAEKEKKSRRRKGWKRLDKARGQTRVNISMVSSDQQTNRGSWRTEKWHCEYYSHVGCLHSLWWCLVLDMVSYDNDALLWTRPPAVVRQCAFVCFGGCGFGGEAWGRGGGCIFSKCSLLLLVSSTLPTLALSWLVNLLANSCLFTVTAVTEQHY